MSRIVFVNGEYLPENDGKISIFDRGFLFADGIYEVTPVVRGRLIDYIPHTERLERSLREVGMDWPCSPEELLAMHQRLIAENNLDEGFVYMQITRGVADRDFKFPKNVTPTLIAFTQVKDLMNNPEARSGIRVITVPDLRWARRDIKSVMLLAPVLGKQAAYEAKADEAWMVEDGVITEGTSSNAYIIKDNEIITRELSTHILAGCTRRALFRLCKKHDIKITERSFTPEEAYEADEAFVTSASNFVLPVVRIDNHTLSNGKPGPLSLKLRQFFLDEVDAETA